MLHGLACHIGVARRSRGTVHIAAWVSAIHEFTVHIAAWVGAIHDFTPFVHDHACKAKFLSYEEMFHRLFLRANCPEYCPEWIDPRIACRRQCGA